MTGYCCGVGARLPDVALLELSGLLLMVLPIELLLLSVLFLAWRCFFVLLVVAMSFELDVEPALALPLLLILGS